MGEGTWPAYLGYTTPPASDPTVGPFVCAAIPEAYLPYVLGSLGQLLQPFSWDVADDAARLSVMDWMDTLISSIAGAGTCPQGGIVSVTIPSGSATGTATVTFPTAFTSAPAITVSCDNPDLIASFTSKTSSGFTAVVTARFAVSADTTCEFDWNAVAVS